MGGTTITQYGKTEEEVLDKLKQQILAGREAGLFPDSAVVLINGDDLKKMEGSQDKEAPKSMAKLFSVTDEGEFTEIEKGKTFHVAVAAMYSKPPDPGEILGTVHMHT